MLVSNFPSVGPFSVNSRLYRLANISNIILFNTSFGLEIVFSHIFGVSLFHSYSVAVYFLSTSGTIHWPNNAPSKPCFDCISSIILTGITSMGSSAFVQFAPINNPTDMLSSSLISSKILSRCPQFFNFDGVATSSLPTGKYFLVYVCRSSSQSSELSLLLATFIPLITDDLLVTSPLSVFMVIDVLLPFIPNLFGNLSKMKVPWLQLSKSA